MKYVATAVWPSIVSLGLLLSCLVAASQAAELPHALPEEVGLDSAQLDQIAGLVNEGISQGKMPGCVVCVGRHGKIAYLQAFGNRQLKPQTEAMTTDTVFDMASITKPMATATSIMKLLEQGKLSLGDKVTNFFPEFAPHGKDAITIKDLLTHQSGLIPDNALDDYQDGPQVAWERICALDLVAPVGTEFKYSDVNFIVLGKLIEKLSGKPVDAFSQEAIYQPLGMTETGYRPSAELQTRCAVTEQRDGHWMRGEVHDPRAFLLDGVAGHAGLFSTARDVALYAQMMLGQGTLRLAEQPPIKVLEPRTVAAMTAAYPVSSGSRGLGWDKQTGYSSNKGDLLSSSAFGHGGFTGTVLWIDPELDLFFVFLSNRLHPNGDGSVNQLAGRIANVIASSLAAAPAPVTQPVLTGIDVLQQAGYRQLAGQRVGLISNHTGRNAAGVSTVQLLHEAKAVDLTTLFSPEHGFEGKLDISNIGDSREGSTGLKIYSLYGDTRRPTPEMLAELDTLVFDIQDIGARFYTYISTMGEAMQAAAEMKKRFVVLDRPNPINGVDVAGPMLDGGKESFVGFHHLPVRHGMTTGELAKLLQAELKLELDLEIIACEGWHRADYWDATGLMWVNPSPNMRSLTQALLYPGVGLLETTNVSVGRGTDTPFEVLGAPWIDGLQLARRLNARGLPGVTFVPIEFTPDSSKFENEVCQGVNILIVDREQLEPLQVGLGIALELRQQFPDAWETKSFDRLLGNEAVLQAVVAGNELTSIVETAAEGVDDFLKRRQKYLIYK